jgi:diguanylate cyclase (GGDEF)-like protein
LNTFILIALGIAFFLNILVGIFLAWVRKVPHMKKGIGWWAIAFFATAMTTIPNLIEPVLIVGHVVNEAAFYLFYIISDLARLHGSFLYFGIKKRIAPFVIAGSLVFMFSLYHNWWLENFFASALLTSCFIGCLQLYEASIFFSHRHQAKGVRQTHIFVAIILSISALHLFDYAFMREVEWFIPIGFTIAMLALMLIALGLAVVMLQDFFELLTSAEQKAKDLAFHDDLTGLHNKRYIDDIFETLCAQAQRMHKPMAVLFLDLNDFKTINDKYGHDAGDQVLQEIARRIQERVRKADIVVRLGGDEFIVLLTTIDNTDDLQTVIDNLQTAIVQPIEVDQHNCCVDVSIGASVFPENGTRLKDLVRMADSAMYRIKEEMN